MMNAAIVPARRRKCALCLRAGSFRSFLKPAVHFFAETANPGRSSDVISPTVRSLTAGNTAVSHPADASLRPRPPRGEYSDGRLLFFTIECMDDLIDDMTGSLSDLHELRRSHCPQKPLRGEDHDIPRLEGTARNVHKSGSGFST